MIHFNILSGVESVRLTLTVTMSPLTQTPWSQHESCPNAKNAIFLSAPNSFSRRKMGPGRLENVQKFNQVILCSPMPH